MAEALAAIGLASSIVAFIDFAQKVVSRLNEFSNDLKDSTNALYQIQTQLPVVIDGLRRIKDRVDSGRLDNAANAALQPIVQACHRQVDILSGILDDVLPASGASRWRRRKKAIQSLAADGKMKKASEILSQHLQTLTFYHSIGDSVPQPVVKKNFWLVPFDRNSNFVGRDSVFDQIDQAFKVPEGAQPKVALYGLGGIGKSQIALEYCFRKRRQDPTCSVFWVNAATLARFEESFQRMAKQFGLNDGDGSQKDTLTSVKTWLETTFVEPWVMIVDNVDDNIVFFQEKCYNDKTISQVLPHCSHGKLLFTSRTRDVSVDLAGPGTPICVDLLTIEEGLALLRKRLGPDPPESDLIEILSELGHIPLAITQAISFIMKRRKSVAEYLDLYHTSERSMGRLLAHDFLDHGRQEQTMESVARTWQISFEWIQRHHPKAAECLCLMAFFQHHDVPKPLLAIRHIAEVEEVDSSESDESAEDFDWFEFDESISVLQAYSLLDVKDSGGLTDDCSTHRLIQVATKLWLGQNGPEQLEEWALRALDQVTTWFPEDIFVDDYWEICQSLLPHADLLLGQSFKFLERESDLKKAELLLKTAKYHEWMGTDREDVNRLLKRSLDIRRIHLGPDHPDTWLGMHIYFEALIRRASVYPPDLGSDGVAEMGRAILNHNREVLGPRHWHYIKSMTDMGKFLAKQGELEDGEAMQREALKLSTEVQGHDSLLTLNCMDRLASVLELMGSWEEASEIWTKSIEIKAGKLGPGHVTILSEKSNLALCLQNLGRLDEAIPMYREVMVQRERILGPDHPDTLFTAKKFAWLLIDDGRYNEARYIVDHVLNVIQASQRVYTGFITEEAFMALRLVIDETESLSDRSSTEVLERRWSI